MASDTLPIARVDLARDARRLLTLPLLLALAGVSAVAAGILLGDATGVAAAVAGGVGVVVAMVLAALPFTVRADVEVGGLRIRWLGGSRHYHLVRGPVTRVSLTGPSAGAIKSRLPVLGWSVGEARMRRDEHILLVRLARTPSVILVPTDAGRVAIAAASEPALLEALSTAARVQQRLDEVSGRVMAALPGGIAEMTATAAQRAAPKAAPAEPAEEEPRFLTGIERARLEERLAAAREAALLAAEAEREAALQAAEASAASGVEAAAIPSLVVPALPSARLARERIRASWTRPMWATDARLRVLVTACWAGVPLLASLGVWLLAGGPPALVGSDAMTKSLGLALTVGGPGAALGVVAARAWWPELAGLVATSGIATLVLTTRAVLG